MTSPSVSPAVARTISDGSDYADQQLPQFTFTIVFLSLHL